MILECFLLCGTVILLMKYWQKYTSNYWKSLMEIPGPSPKPIVGNLFDMLGDTEFTFKAGRERAIKYYPIYRLTALGNDFVAVVSPEDMELILPSMKHLTKNKMYNNLHSWLGTGLLTSAGSKWQSRRKLLTPAFHFSILQEFVQVFNKETKNLIEALKKQSDEPYTNLIQPMSELTLSSIGETSMGTNLNTAGNVEKATYKKAVADFGQITFYKFPRPWLWNPLIYKLTALSKTEKETTTILHTFSKNVIEERKKNFAMKSDENLPGSNKKKLAMLDLLLSFKAKGADITDEGIKEEVDTFIFAGHDTTSMSICYSLMLLANHPKVQDEIVEEINGIVAEGETPSFKDLQEMNYLERCLKESLRLYPVAPIIGRIAGEDIKTHSGYTIPKGCNILMHIYNMHHSPNVYEDPEKFDPDRFLPDNFKDRHPYSYIPFSAGPRNCIGQKFALLEIKTVICGILRNFRLEAVTTPKDVVFLSDILLTPKEDIKVKFIPRN